MPAQLRRSAWLIALTAVLAIAGCGGQQAGTDVDDNAGDADSGEAVSGAGGALCSILTEQDITQIAGGEVTASDLRGDSCDFTIEETSLVNIRYESQFDPNLETARMICDDGEDVSGIGDQAIWCPSVNVLYFNKGDHSVAVQLVYVMDDPGREQKDIASDIARRVADGL